MSQKFLSPASWLQDLRWVQDLYHNKPDNFTLQDLERLQRFYEKSQDILKFANSLRPSFLPQSLQQELEELLIFIQRVLQTHPRRLQ